jgi:hypothetical protein
MQKGDSGQFGWDSSKILSYKDLCRFNDMSWPEETNAKKYYFYFKSYFNG